MPHEVNLFGFVIILIPYTQYMCHLVLTIDDVNISGNRYLLVQFHLCKNNEWINSEQLPIVGFEMILCLLEYCYNFLGKGNTRQVD